MNVPWPEYVVLKNFDDLLDRQCGVDIKSRQLA